MRKLTSTVGRSRGSRLQVGLVLLAVVVATGLLAGVSHAAPILSIAGGVNETVGDPGGTSSSLANGALAGRGIPTAIGGWPTGGPGFGPDGSFGGAIGTTGFASSPQAGGLLIPML